MDVDGVEKFAGPASAKKGEVRLLVKWWFGACWNVRCGGVVVRWFEFPFEGFGEEVGFGLGVVDPCVVGVFECGDGRSRCAVVEKLSVYVPPLL